jgi:hypothetical protein
MLEMISGRVWAQSFVTKCEDPAAFMDSFMTVSSCVEIPMTCTPGRKRLIRRVASIPLILGIYIHDNDLRKELKGHLNSCLSVHGRTDNGYVFVILKETTEGLPKGGKVVDHENAKQSYRA